MRRAWSPIRSCARWARWSAACATTIRPATGRRSRWPPAPRSSCAARPEPRRVKIDDFLVDSFTTAVGEGEMALGVRVSGARRSHGRFVPEGRAQGRRLRHRRGGRAGLAERRRHDPRARAWRCRPPVRAPCAWTRPSVCSPARNRRAELIRAAADAASKRSAPQADLRGSVEYKKHLAGVLVSRAVCVRRSRVWGCRHEGHGQGQRRRATSGRSSRARCSRTSCAKTAG